MIVRQVSRGARRGVALAVWSAQLRRRGRMRAALTSLRAQQWMSSAALRDLQNRKLRRLIEHAFAHVPYYRRVMMERGVRPEHIRTVDDLALLPLLTRDIIQEQGDELRAVRGVDRPDLVKANHTGGSTGMPLTFFQDEAYREWGLMDLARDFEMCGYRPGDPIAFLWGSDYDARPHRTLRGKLKNALENRLFLDAFDSTEQDFVAFARQLAAFRPRLLVGYVSSLTLLARVVQAHGLRGVRPGAIQTSAEVLTQPQRALLEQTFGCEVFDRYGCREVGNIAHECGAHRGLHILADNNAVEILCDERPARPGEEGQLAVTNLNNMAMPFIRYVNGDLGVAGDGACPCGRGLPLMQSVVGRSADIIVTPSGKLLHGEFFTHLFYKVAGVKELQVVQRSPTRLDISLVPGSGFDESGVTAFLETVIHEYGDPSFDVRFHVTDRIARSASGKYRFTISEMPMELAASAAR